MNADKLSEGIYRLTSRLSSDNLFEGIWPLPHGVMVNAYLIKGKDKIAVIDYFCDWDNSREDVALQLRNLGIKGSDIDYLIINHMEPDHTGDLNFLLDKYKNIKIVTSARSVPLLESFYGVKNEIMKVKTGDTLDLGGRTLCFYDTPNVHWPETIMTYLKEEKILFSCDAFGSFGVFDKTFHDELNKEELELYLSETERYYVNIISTFSKFVLKAIASLGSLDIKMICPSHGVVYRKNCEIAVNHYKKLAQYSENGGEKEVTFLYSSMYGNTEALVKVVEEELKKAKIKFYTFKIPGTHDSFVLEKVWRSKGLIVGVPSYEMAMFYPMAHTLDALDRSHIKGKKLIRFGSYGWCKGAEKELLTFVEKMNLDYLGQVEFKGRASEEDVKALRDLTKELIKSLE